MMRKYKCKLRRAIPFAQQGEIITIRVGVWDSIVYFPDEKMIYCSEESFHSMLEEGWLEIVSPKMAEFEKLGDSVQELVEQFLVAIGDVGKKFSKIVQEIQKQLMDEK